ncbi:hypothetical protein AV530_002961 [Patagioenas fasciata monilis]|uniref:Uncharacterized protein n=1 Tax=Patagioenas fasciata monilis TaxID=372326 RepID=A0A1V4K352_PATFA|nr:hypothetical protein AV530_002961 [Patagioenas fasciata monilis]
MELSCETLRTAHQAREADEMRTEARRKNLLILILHYLMDEGYVDAANALEQETKLSLRGFEVCDNIDLETILMEYESYYFVKFQKYPKITKKVLDTDVEEDDIFLSLKNYFDIGKCHISPKYYNTYKILTNNMFICSKELKV